MAKVFEGLPYVKVYMDDILIHSTDKESHMRHVKEVLSRLRKYRFYLKLRKC